MRVVVAPENYDVKPNDVLVFLAGGITNCPNWQSAVIEEMRKYDLAFPGQLDDLVVFNPRRENFPIDDPKASQEQITWEFEWLSRMDVFTMYFSAGESEQPICLYELGRNVARMQERFDLDFDKRIVVTCDPNYKRFNDVKIQTKLAYDIAPAILRASSGKIEKPILNEDSSPTTHMYYILRAYLNAKEQAKKYPENYQHIGSVSSIKWIYGGYEKTA